MHHDKLHDFVDEILRLQAGVIGLGAASSGITGSIGGEGMAGETLKRDVLTFAAAYTNPRTDRQELIALAQAVEGSLNTAKVFDNISYATLERLTKSLHALLA